MTALFPPPAQFCLNSCIYLALINTSTFQWINIHETHRHTVLPSCCTHLGMSLSRLRLSRASKQRKYLQIHNALLHLDALCFFGGGYSCQTLSHNEVARDIHLWKINMEVYKVFTLKQQHDLEMCP